MKLICYGSSSRGNGYILQGKQETLLLEAGLPLSNARRLGVDFRQVVGTLISHQHGDHSKYIADHIKAGIDVYVGEEMWSENKQRQGCKQIGAVNPIKIGDFTVRALPANHDVPCLAFLIHHEEMGKLLFLTDSSDFDYSVANLDHIMIECNWSEECLQIAIDEGRTNQYVAARSRATHMGLDQCINLLTYDDMAGKAQEVILLHLSHENSDPKQFPLIVGKEINKPVYVAENGFQIELTNGNNIRA